MNYIIRGDTRSSYMDIKPLIPFGIQITPRRKMMIEQCIPGHVLADLTRKHHLVLIRETTSISKHALINYSQRIGPLLEWDFGLVMEMRVNKNIKNYLFTHGPVPFHWDGAFYRQPRYLLFHCIAAPMINCGGETLFTNTNLVWKNASAGEKKEWKKIKITYETKKLAHYGGKISVPLVQKHPNTRKTILRFAEPVPENWLNPVKVMVEDYNIDDSTQFIIDLATRCYDAAFCYPHVWEKNDLLIADNYTLIHARHAFTRASPRHLRRIQIL